MNASNPAKSTAPLRRGIVMPQSCRGSAILTLLILSVVAAIALASAFTYVSRSASLQKRSDLRLESTYAAEYAFEKAFQQLKSLISVTSVPNIAQTTAATNLSTAPTSVFGTADGYKWTSYLTVPISDGVVVGTQPASPDPARGTFKYLTVVELERNVAPNTQPVKLTFQREWIYEFKPLFQYAIFYNTDMELFPGRDFIVSGRVHSNGMIYTGTSATITFKDFVTHIDGMSNSYSPLDPRAPGSPGNAITYAKTPVATTREDPPGSTTADTTDSNFNNDGPRELIEIPDSAQNDDNASDRLYNKSGLKVLANSTSSPVTTASGVTVPAHSRVYVTSDGTIIPSGDPLGAYLDTMFATGSMNDYREGSNVTTTDVDVGKMTTGYNAGGLPETIPASSKWPNNSSVPSALKNKTIPAALQGKSFWNGILYVADVTDSTSHPTGIKIVNGANLPDGTAANSSAKGLTIASQNAAYVVGDYNTGGTPAVNSSASLTDKNYVDGYTSSTEAADGYHVQPASIAADAVTVVSSKWNSGNYNSVSSLASRTPANTTINTALISGIVPSDGSAYSGGVENYIRLLENWTGKRLTYYGSIINLYKSEQAKAPWKDTGNYYNAPTRNWYFDTQFTSPSRLPPGTPTLRTVKKGQWAQLQ